MHLFFPRYVLDVNYLNNVQAYRAAFVLGISLSFYIIFWSLNPYCISQTFFEMEREKSDLKEQKLKVLLLLKMTLLLKVTLLLLFLNQKNGFSHPWVAAGERKENYCRDLFFPQRCCMTT